MLTSPEISNEMFTKCVDERMKAPKERRIDIFAKIPKSKIRTRLEKIKVKGNTLDAIKEDSQAFGLLVGKVQSPNEALKYPLTTVPLALAESDQTLCQQSTKATLHRFFHEKSDSVVKVNEADGLNCFLIENQKMLHAQKVCQLYLIRIAVPQSSNQSWSKEVTQVED